MCDGVTRGHRCLSIIVPGSQYSRSEVMNFFVLHFNIFNFYIVDMSCQEGTSIYFTTFIVVSIPFRFDCGKGRAINGSGSITGNWNTLLLLC